MGLSRQECAALPRDSSASSPPPSAFGRFRVVHQVGVGVLGPVFRAYDPEQDRAVAVKAFPLDITPERARDLAADLAKLPELGLDHPAAITPLAAGSEGATAYLVQEYFVAESADVALKQYGPAPVPDAMRLVGQLAGALDAAAGEGVHHGALHPRDILVAPHEVRLTGIGVAEALERVGVRVPVRRPYAAPERSAGGPVTAAADVFSLACVAFELITGRRPAQSGESVTADTTVIHAADAVALSEAFARALSQRPEDRYPSALAFAAALKHALTGEPLAAGAEPDRQKARKAGRSAPRAAAAGVPPPVALPADMLLAAPLGTETPPSSSLELQAAPPPGATPLPSFLESYALAETEPAAVETARLDGAAPGATMSERASLDATVLDGRRQESPPPAPDAASTETGPDADMQALAERPASEPPSEPAPFRLEALDFGREERQTARREPSAPPAQPAPPVPSFAGAPASSPPRRRLLPLLAMLIAGIALGYPAGYLSAPSARPAPASVVAPAAKPAPQPAAVPQAAPPVAPVASPPAAAPAAAVTPKPAAPPAASPAPAAKPAAAKPAAQKPADKKPAAVAKAAPPRAQEPARFVGSLVVVSRPAGATVSLDGRPVGTTPLTLPEVSAGSHAVKLELDGYRTWSVSAEVVSGQQKRVSASLERRERPPEG